MNIRDYKTWDNQDKAWMAFGGKVSRYKHRESWRWAPKGNIPISQEFLVLAPNDEMIFRVIRNKADSTQTEIIVVNDVTGEVLFTVPKGKGDAWNATWECVRYFTDMVAMEM